jgi:hypothetical protein
MFGRRGIRRQPVTEQSPSRQEGYRWHVRSLPYLPLPLTSIASSEEDTYHFDPTGLHSCMSPSLGLSIAPGERLSMSFGGREWG